MAAQIDGKVIPDSMKNKGRYRFPGPELVRRDGYGVGVAAPTRSLEWVFPHLTAAEMIWWKTTLLAGAASKLCTGTTTLYDPTVGGTEVTFSSCVVDAPIVQNSPTGGLYRNVTINIRNIIA